MFFFSVRESKGLSVYPMNFQKWYFSEKRISGKHLYEIIIRGAFKIQSNI